MAQDLRRPEGLSRQSRRNTFFFLEAPKRQLPATIPRFVPAADSAAVFPAPPAPRSSVTCVRHPFVLGLGAQALKCPILCSTRERACCLFCFLRHPCTWCDLVRESGCHGYRHGYHRGPSHSDWSVLWIWRISVEKRWTGERSDLLLDTLGLSAFEISS